MALLLGIETSSSLCSVCLQEEGMLLALAQRDIGYGHASAFYELLEELLVTTKRSLKDVTHVAVTRGPGSFTGVRVGLSIAKGLQLSGGIPILGLTTFEVLSHKYPSQGKQLFALDTKRQDYYGALYDTGVCQKTRIMSMDDIQTLGDVSIFSDKAECFNQAASLTLTAEDVCVAAWQNQQDQYDGFSSDPFYLRPPKVYES